TIQSTAVTGENTAPAVQHRHGFTRREVASAWIPWIILSACVFAWGEPHVQGILNSIGETRWTVPNLHQQVQPDVSVIGGDGKPLPAELRLNWFSATGTGIFIASILSALWMQISPYRFCRLFAHTLYRLRWPLFTIACMLAIAYTTRYSGTDVTLGLAFTHTGVLYPFFAALLGWLGVGLT